jgi:hypothetical protein
MPTRTRPCTHLSAFISIVLQNSAGFDFELLILDFAGFVG